MESFQEMQVLFDLLFPEIFIIMVPWTFDNSCSSFLQGALLSPEGVPTVFSEVKVPLLSGQRFRVFVGLQQIVPKSALLQS